ncbi:hypothetical protein [Roseateles saccharophilus]|uniref:Uncharacterized protein n=1 Tax=Roseateles saccharophilus TaxID=304 RepID=A0A4R3UIB3_ROSSA|nr:hypothetical protein [Roseateles saccharophilus]MDG0834172.1 hypothetical protein [Roseateles saccharophilus]TCU91306.1 hypothetical protein EV671_102621 [Roseateles saccharophilus]
MATQTVSNKAAKPSSLPPDLIEARDQACFHAAMEVGAIAAMLRAQEDADDAEFVRHGALMRVEALGNSLVSLLGFGRDIALEVTEGYEIVFGKPLEVPHG